MPGPGEVGWVPRLIAVDVDGTLVHNMSLADAFEDGAGGAFEMPTRRVLAALGRAVDAGVTLAIATGRPADITLDLAERIGLFRYVVTGNGAQTTLLRQAPVASVGAGAGAASASNREILARDTGGPGTTAAVCEFVEGLRQVQPEIAIVTEVTDADQNGATDFLRDRPFADDNFNWAPWTKIPYYSKVQFVPNLLTALRSKRYEASGPLFGYAPILRTEDGTERGRVAMNDIWDRFVSSPVGKEMLASKRLTTGASKYDEHGVVHAQVMDLNPKKPGEESLLSVQINASDKATALEGLCGRLGITARDVLVFGNDYNDVGMLQWAGRGVVMVDAPEAALKVADEVCPSADDDGIAVVLECMLDDAATAAGKAKL